MQNAGVDPTAIPEKMTDSQLEWWILFGICVAGKGAKQTEKKLNEFLADCHYSWSHWSPFNKVKFQNRFLMRKLMMHRMGQYKRIAKAFRQAVQIDLRGISVPVLEAVAGIGPKTARMIMLYYDPAANCVPLDTHILKYLRVQGYDAPKSTPPAGKTYTRLEAAFQQEAAKAGKTVRQLDTEVWKSYARI